MTITMWLSNAIFQCPPSVLITGMSAVNIISMANVSYSEITGNNMTYSKFSKSLSNNTLIPSKASMLFNYTPSFIAGLVSFWVFPSNDFRFHLLQLSLTIHFLKRVLEVMFLHKYSGEAALDTTVVISLSYLLFTSSMIYSQYISLELGEPAIDLKYLGMVLFLIGITGNFYHHYLLSKMRKPGEKEYKIPKGCLFDLVVCPHYLFEILGFVGISFISQNLYALSYAIAACLYLMGRSYATRKWYLSKFEDFPQNVKAIFPFLF